MVREEHDPALDGDHVVCVVADDTGQGRLDIVLKCIWYKSTNNVYDDYPIYSTIKLLNLSKQDLVR